MDGEISKRKGARDDFLSATIRTLAARVAYRCSNPACGRQTSGPAVDETKAINVGEAAHITAAASGGKRYNASLTHDQRRAESNGIWLCRLCARLIDTDERRFPEELLRQWKQQALDGALKALTTAAPGTYERPIGAVQLDEADREFLRALALPAEDEDIEGVVTRMREAAKRDIAAFRGAKEFPAYTISLALTLHAKHNSHAIPIEGLANGVDAAETLNLVAPPGMGKTTTLVQLAEVIVATRPLVVGLVPLGEWSERLEDVFTFLARRNAFRGFRPQHFMQLAYHGRLTLLLDGWNELDPAARVRAARDLKALRRDYPLLSIVIGTRRDQPAMSGPVVEIEPLSQDQQLELARALRGGDGEALIDQAWRTAGVRDLIAIPLYLTALLGTVPGAAFPQTKEEILRLFVTQHEEAQEKAEILRNELLGFHGDILTSLAIEANRTAITARRVVTDVCTELVARKQLTVALQPTRVIDVLISGHLLIRSSSGDGSVLFQHQQFQEWYASHSVEQLMAAAAAGNADARKKLRADILNVFSWEESILFACERLSRKGEAGAEAVASTIRDALAVDPMLAAEMVYRVGPRTWSLVKDEILAFGIRWHEPGLVDRAVRFMVTTGRPEFAPQIWPLLSEPKNEIYLDVTGAARRFRPSVLGEDREMRLAGLPEEIRRRVIADIARRSGFEGMELAASIARSDPSAKVIVEILQALQFRRGDRFVASVMQDSRDEVWRRVAQKGYPDELADPALDARLAELRRAQSAEEADPIRQLNNICDARPANADAPVRIAAIIESADFPVRNDFADMAVRRAFDLHPKAVADALARRIATGLELPFRVRPLLQGLDPIDGGPVAAAAVDKTTPDRVARAAFTVVGPKTVGVLIDQFFAMADEREKAGSNWGQAESTEYGRVRDAIAATRQDSFLTALLARARSDQPERIRLLADLLASHRGVDDETRIAVPETVRSAVVNAIESWITTLMTAPEANRHQLSVLTGAIARFPEKRFIASLQQMLERDLMDEAREREERTESRRVGVHVSHAMINYNLVYQTAFVAIGGDETTELMKIYLGDLRFGLQAAGALFEIWYREHPPATDRRFGSWHDYSNARALAKQRRAAPRSLATCDLAEAIFDVATRMSKEGVGDDAQRHALALATVGLGLPHGSKRAEIDALLALPQPYAAKQRLLIASAMAGEIVPADVLAAGVDELLEAGKTQPWRLARDRGEMMSWIELFAFSDRPPAVLDAINLLPQHNRDHWNLERLVHALGKSPHVGALSVLDALARSNENFFRMYDWVNAIIELGTEEAGLFLVGITCERSSTSGLGMNAWHLADHLARFALKFPAIKAEMLRRYEAPDAGRGKDVLERALAKLADSGVVLALVRGFAAERRPYGGGLAEAVREIAVGQRPVADWPDAVEYFTVPLGELRRQLFGLAVAGGPQSSVAESCLVAIDELRDEHGHVVEEPRHPDIASGTAWPILH
jgi:hypothetical protein